MGQVQPRVIVWKILVVLPYMMLHTKFQGHGSIGSGVEDFLRFLPYMGMAAMLVMWPTHLYKFLFLFTLKLSNGLWFQIAQLFLRKTSFDFEIWVTFDQGQRTTLTFDTHSTSLALLAKCFKQLWDLRLKKFAKDKQFSLFPIHKPMWPNLTLA